MSNGRFPNYGYYGQQRSTSNFMPQSPSTSSYFSPISRAPAAYSPLMVPNGYLHNNSPNGSVDVFETPPPRRKNAFRDEKEPQQSLSDAIKSGMDMVDNDDVFIVPNQNQKQNENRNQERPRQSIYYNGMTSQRNLMMQQVSQRMVPSPAQLLHQHRHHQRRNNYRIDPSFYPDQQQPAFQRNSPYTHHQQTQLSVDPFESQRYSDTASILASVSSSHSRPRQSAPFAVPQMMNSVVSNRGPPKMNYFDQWSTKNKTKKTMEDELKKQMDDDFMPYGIERKSETNKKQKPKQIRMDEYLFKARRVDKGSREFGLKTTHEPKRGSKKKRDSIDKLEIENELVSQSSGSTTSSSSEYTDNTIEVTSHVELDMTIPLTSPLRVNTNTKKVDDLDKTPDFDYSTKKWNGTDGSKKSNIPAFRKLYQNCNLGSQLAETVPLKTLEKSIEVLLDETVPLATPSPARNRKKRGLDEENNVSYANNVPKRTKTNSFKSTQVLSETSDSPLKFMFSQVGCSSSQKQMPTFDIPSPIVLSENEDDDIQSELVVKNVENRKILVERNSKRKLFDEKTLEREKMIKDLVSDGFVEQRATSMDQQKEMARTALKDGEVIRNKGDRKRLMHGNSCKCCQGYYDKLDMTPEGKKQYIDQVSRHRFVNMPLPDTPEHYWDLTMGPSDEQLMEGSGIQGNSGAEKDKRREWSTNEKATRGKLATWN